MASFLQLNCCRIRKSEVATMLNIQMSVAALLLATSIGAFADGYLVDSSNHVVRSGSGSCVHTGYWQPEDAVVGCDGKVAVVLTPPVAVAPVTSAAPELEHVSLAFETYFDFDRADLNPIARDKLSEVISMLRGYHDLVAIRVIGHADRIGTEDYNQQLAMRRAEAVTRYLVGSDQVDPELLTIVSMGESDPLVSCPDVHGQPLIDCLAPNRRVELEVSATELR
jgi:OOP family OmpA-OmpF porin